MHHHAVFVKKPPPGHNSIRFFVLLTRFKQLNKDSKLLLKIQLHSNLRNICEIKSYSTAYAVASSFEFLR